MESTFSNWDYSIRCGDKFFEAAIQAVNNNFGKGFAKDHPEIVIGVMDAYVKVGVEGCREWTTTTTVRP
tara:strand:- start:369 stop:575 length:207 start_codon:yes stop_codon:yes gene_type:complete